MLTYGELPNNRVNDVPNANIERTTDVLVKITSSNICGSDLHMYEGRTSMKPGRILVNENLGVVTYGASQVMVVDTERDRLALADAPEAYANFNERKSGGTKVVLKPGM